MIGAPAVRGVDYLKALARRDVRVRSVLESMRRLSGADDETGVRAAHEALERLVPPAREGWPLYSRVEATIVSRTVAVVKR